MRRTEEAIYERMSSSSTYGSIHDTVANRNVLVRNRGRSESVDACNDRVRSLKTMPQDVINSVPTFVNEVDDQENDIDRESLRLNRLKNGATHCASQENQSNSWPHVLTDVIFNLMITIINVIMCVPCLYG